MQNMSEAGFLGERLESRPLSSSRQSVRSVSDSFDSWLEPRSADESDEQIEQYQLPEDSYSEMFMSLIEVGDLLQRSRVPSISSLIQIVIFFLCFSVTLLLEFGLSFWLFATTIENREDMYEYGLEEKIHELESSIVAHVPLAADNGAHDLCLKNKVLFLPAYLLVVFLWISKMVPEMVDAIVMLRQLCLLATPDDYREQLQHEVPELKHSRGNTDEEEDPTMMIKKAGTIDDPSFQVVALVPWVRFTVFVIILIPKVIGAFWITWLGTKFLIFAHDMGTLIIKALCCQYFVGIDEILYKSFISEGKKMKIKKTKTVFEAKKASLDWINWQSSLTRLVLVAAVTNIIVWVGFGRIMVFRDTCHDYTDEFNLSNETLYPGLEVLFN